MSKLRVLIFDDDPSREDDYKQMESSGNIAVEFKCLKDVDPIEVIGKSPEGQFDIIFVDHKLNCTKPESRKLIGSGKSITPMLRERWQNIPIIGVTAAKDDCIMQDGATYFEEIYDYSDINKLELLAHQIVGGYEGLKQANVDDLAGFINLLLPPEEEITKIQHFIPDEFLNLKKGLFHHSLYRWFRRVFYAYPGFIYDSAWTAMIIGVDLEYFDLYSEQLNKARYNGLWNDHIQPRWWKQILYSEALKNRESMRDSLQKSACKEFGIAEEHFSKCYKCQEIWPEVLAYTDESSEADVVPVHLGCSIAHPGKRYLGSPFEEPRLVL